MEDAASTARSGDLRTAGLETEDSPPLVTLTEEELVVL